MKYVIFDLDGCISDDRRRWHLVDRTAPDPFKAYHSQCHRDPLINGHLITFTAHCEPIIFTARPERVRAKTERWLRKVAKLNARQVLMRSKGCYKGSPALKLDFLQALFMSGVKARDIVCAFDDREDILEIYRIYGIPTIKVSYPMEVNSHESNPQS